MSAPDPDMHPCVSESVFAPTVRHGHLCRVLEVREQKEQVRVVNERGRKRWYSTLCFERLERPHA